MNLKSITSLRNIANYPSIKIVYEWEDIISQELCIPIKKISYIRNKWYSLIRRMKLCQLYHSLKRKDNNISLMFIMRAKTFTECFNNKNTIPIIIDFWLDETEFESFYESYKNCPLVLISSREIYDLLIQNNCPLKIEHWPLSLPDNNGFYMDKNYKKEYEFCLIGRPNPFFIRLLNEYCTENPDFTYIKNNDDIKNRFYVTNKGEFITKDSGRESYIEMIRKTKITCYTTPGMDEAKKETKSYNQVTPRLLEMLSSGCHVIGHYPKNSDTEYYDLSSIVPNINNYSEFKTHLDEMRNKNINIKKLKEFLSKHYTSQRVILLKEILQKHNIMISPLLKY